MNTWNSAFLCLLIFLSIKPSTAYAQKIKSIDSFIESIRNRYEIPGVALAVLKDKNVYDSYGEALLLAGRNEEARKMYKKSLELNPQNERGRQILQSIP